MKRVWLAWLIVGVCAMGARGQFTGIHGAKHDAYQKWFDKAKEDGYRPVFVSGCDAGGKPEFTAVAVKDDGRAAWEVRDGLSADQFQKVFDELTGKDFRLTWIDCYMDGKNLRHAGIWMKDGSKQQSESRHNMTAAQYQDAVTALGKKGLRPGQVSVSGDGKGEPRFAAIFIEEGKIDWIAKHDIPIDQFQKLFEESTGKGMRLSSQSVYPTKNGMRLAVVFDKQPAASWSSRLGMTPAQYQKEFDKNSAAGMRPLTVSPYREGNETHYAAVFIDAGPQDLPLAPPLVMTGTHVAALDLFDETMQTFMRERHIKAGTLAVIKDGKLQLSRGYGHADPDGKREIAPDDPFRIASICKPITAAAVRKLIRDKKLTYDTKAFGFLGIEPQGKESDPRLKEITIQHLLDHKGGWDRDAGFDPMFRSREIAKALGKNGPASSEDVVRYMAGQPLQFDPGSKSVYSNFGYCVLGRVIEKATGKTYEHYIQEAILAPLDIKSIELGHTLAKDRNRHEPAYLDPNTGSSVFDGKTEVPAADGSFYLEAMDSHGGLIASAPDLARFGAAYWINGEPRKPGEKNQYAFFGSLPGTHTMLLQRPDGVVIAALFNQRTDPSRKDYNKIYDMMMHAADDIKKWPE